MPLYIRRLPASDKHTIVPSSGGQMTFFNPSRAGDTVYVRVTEFVQGGLTQKNKALMYDVPSKKTSFVETPWNQLMPTVNLFQGIEDLRICYWKGTLWFAGTTTHASAEMTNELIVGYFNPSVTEVAFVTAVDIGSLPVKNVCPFVWNEELCLWDTFKRCVYRVNYTPANTESTPSITAETVQTFTMGPGLPDTQYRGSTSPVHLHGSIWGCVVHDIIFNDTPAITFRLSYIHHWMEFDIERGQITFISQPFFIAHWGIEYVSGIHVCDPSNPDKITLYVGVEDKNALECHTRLQDLRFGKAVR